MLDADIRGFFDTIDQGWLIKFIEHRIADRRILRLIQKWLKASVMEQGKRMSTDVGSPQGTTVSPLLANICLHYALDLWVQRWKTQHALGDVIIVRYADDFVLGFQRAYDAKRLLAHLRERLAKFRLELHPDKTLYDGANQVEVNGNLMLRGGNLDEVETQVTSAGTINYLTDGLGSVSMLTDSSGNPTTLYSYGAYGTTASTGVSGIATVDTPFKYTGADYNSVDDLYYFRNRYYSPHLQRFISEDPIGLGGGLNVNAYVGGNPISYSDPLGLWRLPDYLAFELDAYVFTVSATYTAYGDIYLGGGFARPYPNPSSIGVSISDGWVTPKNGWVTPKKSSAQSSCNVNDSVPTREQLNAFVSGYSTGVGAYAFIGGSVSANSSGRAFNLGVGFGGVNAVPGVFNSYRGNLFGW